MHCRLILAAGHAEWLMTRVVSASAVRPSTVDTQNVCHSTAVLSLCFPDLARSACAWW
jgi:hypothetical protein